MTDDRGPFIVAPDWLFARLDDPSVKVVDGSWYLPAMRRDARAEFDMHHVPGAVFFDVDAASDPDSPLPHMLTGPEQFARYAGRLGLSDRDTIVVYDGMGLFSAPRVWWNLRLMGAVKTVILDGGLPAWIEARLPVESGSAPLYPALFGAHRATGQVATLDEMVRIVRDGDEQIVDARPAGRFAGTEPEPRAGMRSGHMPGARSLPATDLQENGRLLPPDRLRAVLRDAGVDPNKPAVTTCGSGVTAATITLALETLGAPTHRLYDGSWSEWGGREDTPVDTGN